MESRGLGAKKMIVITAPSGAGKTTIVKHLLQNYSFLDFSVSATTRSKRDYEAEGKDYYFLSVQDFKEKVQNNEFLEWEEVYENQYYGTLKSEIERCWNNGKTVVFDIDVNGAANIKDLYCEQCLTIFVRPPSLEVLIDRLQKRNTESVESLNKRIEKVKREMTYEDKFDTVIVNDLLEVSLKEAEYLVENFVLGMPFVENQSTTNLIKE